ncbi:MAG: bifunctional ring 1,2-epoxyphenylacetyl-CoA isomerase/3,4-dehydroadipyl-CoA isomerase PaaG [Roseibaca calidilacus]|uniref:Bifunctional ring 1,2-epoxyphenylacetyl-CoA isomerase/3,4-dehydroadipyl-CoA isomerase PaaG n=1 Tax=Roseibaca calidilacus TaxID=1666912 RepID=A0A0P7W8T8_9RHOB|nr:2-(1,2-epoxy-1,2-dihydrophenyl)acetyl-CoA isomerase PaaG [Roseibaca calidilacus]KPP90532.1 MAG: bifunctional ring 1,2-epoxyphenylacetyl-CoA isomerase/3,4-dehydroadipyl-CoA isomerase PaaG [Roseibaca calidilacus]CUX83370.1 short chain enoyl-CoA hydratase [Roseibaca calidilacus]
MPDDLVLHRLDTGVLELVLNRPDKLNAFTPEMHMALRAQIDRAAQDGAVRAVLLTGAGRGFCAGQDLGERDPRKAGPKPDLGATIGTYYNPLIRAIRALPKPVVAAVNGVAAGAGANIALACDIVLASDMARFVQSFAKLGLVPDAGGSWALPRLLGEARAKALALTGEPLSATQAADWGLIWRAVPDDALMPEARALALKLAKGPTYGLGLTKQAIQAAATNSLDAQLDLEQDYQRRAGASADYAEGVTAFLEKRDARFTGQ